MPRRSQASLTLVHLTAGPLRLKPPCGLGGVEAQIFRETVASVPPEHFQAEDLPLLEAYSRAAALERRAAEELQSCAVVGGQPSPWLAVHASAVRSLAALATKLRLGPRARNPSNRRSAKSGASPSYYETMDLHGDS
jgi:phage terminase small subunit